jgi:hypothetical protein
MNFLFEFTKLNISSLIVSQHPLPVGTAKRSLQSHRDFIVSLDINVKTVFRAVLESLLLKVAKYYLCENSKFCI